MIDSNKFERYDWRLDWLKFAIRFMIGGLVALTGRAASDVLTQNIGESSNIIILSQAGISAFESSMIGFIMTAVKEIPDTLMRNT